MPPGFHSSPSIPVEYIPVHSVTVTCVGTAKLSLFCALRRAVTSPRFMAHHTASNGSSYPPTTDEVSDPNPAAPSPSYLATSLTPSHHLLPPHPALPKLLILDLNGTLLHRSRSRSHIHIHPRPYLPTFIHFALHHARAWLDTMVWSSAQPQNVNDMVERCFGRRGKAELVGVWARDKLGLSRAEYRAFSPKIPSK